MFFFYDPTLWLITWVMFVLGSIALLVFFVLTLVAAMNCLEQCGRRNREMDPNQVWLALIPAFGLVWSYFVVLRVEEALKREFRSRGLKRPKDFGQPLGLSALICWHAGALLICIAIGALGLLAAAGLFIPYWQGLTKYHKQLQRSGGRRDTDDRYDDEEDDYDDRPRRRSRRDRDDEEEEEERPRRRSRREREDEEEEEDRPRRRRRDEDDEEEPPPRRTPPKPDDEGGWKK